jgi:hypothetical protein
VPQPVVETADFVLQNGLTVSGADQAGRRCNFAHFELLLQIEGIFRVPGSATGIQVQLCLCSARQIRSR